MVDVDASITQLRKAFRTHYKYSKGNDEEISHLLLLFYAVECGLKAMYLKEHNGLSTSEFITLPVGKKHGHSHNLWEWFKLLKLPNCGYSDNKEDRPIVQMHERLRYGAYNLTLLEKKQIEFLKHLVNILSKTI